MIDRFPQTTDNEMHRLLQPIHNALANVEELAVEPGKVVPATTSGFQKGDLVFLFGPKIYSRFDKFGVNAVVLEGNQISMSFGKGEVSGITLTPHNHVFLNVDSGEITQSPDMTSRLQYLGIALTSSDFLFRKYPILEP